MTNYYAIKNKEENKEILNPSKNLEFWAILSCINSLFNVFMFARDFLKNLNYQKSVVAYESFQLILKICTSYVMLYLTGIYYYQIRCFEENAKYYLKKKKNKNRNNFIFSIYFRFFNFHNSLKSILNGERGNKIKWPMYFLRIYVRIIEQLKADSPRKDSGLFLPDQRLAKILHCFKIRQVSISHGMEMVPIWCTIFTCKGLL